MYNYKNFDLSDGRMLVQWFGKYCPNLNLIVDAYDDGESPLTQYGVRVRPEEYNLGEGDLTAIKGDFFISKKGSPMFAVKEDGKHILLADSWGGCFNDYKGRNLPEDGLYYRRASSNGGGAGYDYAIVNKGYWKTYNLEDL